MWYTKDYKLVKKSDPGRRRSLAPAFVLFYRRCLTTNSIANRMPRLLAMLFVLLGLFCAAALPAHAEDYDTVLDRLSRLQALAREYSANQTDTPDPIELTLAYTRTGEYNTTIWQLTAGVRDAGFESCVNSSDPELASLQNMNTVVLPNGESIDFGHLLASMNLVYNGIPITGSWGGDCEELARQYYGQAGDAAGYAEAMRASFNIDDDGTLSRFSNGDLRADLDSVVVGSKVTKDTDLAEALRSYYANLTEYDRVKEFISLSFGTVDTSSTAFADAVYSALLEDSGMQLLFYMNGMWTVKGWQIKDDYAPAVRGATDLFAEYLANAVNHEKIKSETNDRLVAMGGQPMTTIKGFVDGILDGTIPPEMQNHYLQLVSEETGRLARLIQNMLDLSKLESGEYQVNARMFNIWETLTGVALAAEQRINDGMIELEGLTMDEKVLVYADPDLIHQVAYNLLDNAIKFTPAGGTIRFSVEKLGPEAEISIWNSGQGISPEALPYVFERFYKEDRSRGLHARGSGLGLNICKVLVNLAGGQIRVESQQGEWCRFVFTLPTCSPNPGGMKRLPDAAGQPGAVEDPASMKPVE